MALFPHPALRTNRGWAWLFAGMAVASMFSGVVLLTSYFGELRVSILLSADPGGRTELFYRYRNAEYNREQRHALKSDKRSWQEHHFSIKPRRLVESLRVDPIAGPGTIRVARILVRTAWGEWAIPGSELADHLSGIHDLSVIGVTEGVLVLLSEGDDPQFSVPLIGSEVWPTPWAVMKKAVPAFLAGIAIVLLVALLYYLTSRYKAQLQQGFLIATDPIGKVSDHLFRTHTLYRWLIFGSAGAVFFVAHLQIAHITPLFQGPDEPSHVNNSVQGLYSLMGVELACGETWSDLNDLYPVMSKVFRKPEVKFETEDIDSLRLIEVGGGWASTAFPPERALSSTCSSQNIIHKYLYNVLAFPAAKIDQEFSALDYVMRLRQGQLVLAFVLYGLLVFVVMRGEFVLKRFAALPEDKIRVVVLLSLFAYASIPQNIFMLSVVNREAYLVPLGMFLIVSMLFRVRFLTLGLLMFAAYAFWPRKAIYLMLVGLVVVYYGALLPKRKKLVVLALVSITVLIVLFATILPRVLEVAHDLRGTLRIVPNNILALQDPGHYYRVIWPSISVGLSLDILKHPSFFGRMGWLDTTLDPRALQLQMGMFWLLGFVFLTAIASNLSMPRAWFTRPRIHVDTIGLLVFFIVTVPLVVGLMHYATYEALYGWRPGARWGSGVQGRYFLPTHYYVFLYYFLGAFWFWLVRSKSSPVSHRAFLLGVVTVFGYTAVVLGVNLYFMHDAINLRYFEDVDVLKAYNELLR